MSPMIFLVSAADRFVLDLKNMSFWTWQNMMNGLIGRGPFISCERTNSECMHNTDAQFEEPDLVERSSSLFDRTMMVRKHRLSP